MFCLINEWIALYTHTMRLFGWCCVGSFTTIYVSNFCRYFSDLLFRKKMKYDGRNMTLTFDDLNKGHLFDERRCKCILDEKIFSFRHFLDKYYAENVLTSLSSKRFFLNSLIRFIILRK